MDNKRVDNIFRELENQGNNVSGALVRVLNDRDLYLTCLTMVTKDQSIDELGDAITDGNITKAYENSHKIKGVFANMGLTIMYNISSDMVEILKKGSLNGVKQLYETLVKENNNLRSVIGYDD